MVIIHLKRVQLIGYWSHPAFSKFQKCPFTDWMKELLKHLGRAQEECHL
jgi:hypothetical protein